MKTALKIFLLVLAAVLILKFAPVFLIPTALALAAIALFGGCVIAAILGVCSGLLGAAVVILGIALVLLAVLSPVWIPILAIVGLIALVKKLSAKSA